MRLLPDGLQNGRHVQERATREGQSNATPLIPVLRGKQFKQKVG